MTLNDVLSIGGQPFLVFYKFCQGELVVNNLEFLVLVREIYPALGPTTLRLMPRDPAPADPAEYVYRRCIAPPEEQRLRRVRELIRSGQVTFDGTNFAGLETNGITLSDIQKRDLAVAYKKSEFENRVTDLKMGGNAAQPIRGTKFGRTNSQVNLPGEIQRALEERHRANTLTVGSFNAAYQDILALTQNDTWRRFIATEAGQRIADAPAPAQAVANAVVPVAVPANAPALNAIAIQAVAPPVQFAQAAPVANDPADPTNHLRLAPPPSAAAAAPRVPASAAPAARAVKPGPHILHRQPAAPANAARVPPPLPPLPDALRSQVRKPGPHLRPRRVPQIVLMPLPPLPPLPNR